MSIVVCGESVIAECHEMFDCPELSAIGAMIIEAGFKGVRGIPVGDGIVWQIRADTPEGVFFAVMYEMARQGHKLPNEKDVGEVLAHIKRGKR